MITNRDGTVTISKAELITAGAYVLRSDGIQADDEAVNLFSEFLYVLSMFLFDMGDEAKEYINRYSGEMEEIIAGTFMNPPS